MSDLSAIEKSILEKFLGMGSGYVLGFTDREFQEFVLDWTGRDIFDAAYNFRSGSKANRTRRFWQIERNCSVAELLDGLLRYAEAHGLSELQTTISERYKQIVERLNQDTPVQELDAISFDITDKGFSYLRDSIKESIDKGKPEAGIDRLHTYAVKFLRYVCSNRGLPVEKHISLPALMGQYLRHIRSKGLIESEITDKILRSSISLLDTLNAVRNERSLAHDNPLLNYHESILILNQVCSTIRFIFELEKVVDRQGRAEEEFILPDPDDDLPF
jgi:hypothetical protein